jgi:DNA-binding SARP family transcriptional activator
MVVKVLGPLETGTDPLGPRERTVLSALIVRVGSTVAPAELAEAWWGESPPRTWEQQIRNSVARIRGRLGRESIETLGWEYRLGLEPDSIDAFRFERLVSTARGHVLRSEHDRAVDAYGRALAMWRGAPLQDVARWEPGVVEAMRLHEIRSSAEEELLDARLASGEHRSLIPDAERLLREDPLREDRWAIVALANYRANRQAEALAVVRRARERLADELGVEPGPRLAALELAMLRSDPSLEAPTPAPMTTGVCPYPGLRPFGPDDSEVFFGREEDIETLLERIQPGVVVTIAGASGTGKSSLLLAGILPRLRARGVAVEVVRPSVGGAPALVHAAERAQIVAIDQAEEVLSGDRDEQDEFANAANSFLAGGNTILVTLRSDGLDGLRALPGIGDAIGRGVYVLGGLSDAAYRSAIEEPARQSGLALEPGLVEIAVRDAGDRSSTLPHLSHAMQETWTRREGATLTVDGYQRSGGIPGAIAQSAEDAFQALSADEQAICRSLMLRLIERGVDGVAARRRVAADPLLSDGGRRRVLERLTRARLVTLDGDGVIVAHEAVASAWPRLYAWLEEDAESARTMRSVEVAAATWDAGGREEDDLLRGARLHSALTWRDATGPDMTRVEEDFLAASDAREQGEIRELRERASRDKRRNRVLGGALAGAGVLLVAAIVAGSFAGIRGQEAAEAAQDAQIEALVATSLSLHSSDRELAALLGAEAYRRWPDDGRVRSALFGTMTTTEGLLDTHRLPEATTSAMVVIPGTGTSLRVAEVADATTIEVVDPSDGAVIRSIHVDLPPPGTGWYRNLSVSRDGTVAAIQTGRLVDSEDTGTCCWNHLTFVNLASGEVLPGSQLLKMRTSEVIDLGEDGSVAFIQHPHTGALIAVDTRTQEVRASARAAFYDYTGLEPTKRTTGAVVEGDQVATGTGDRVDVFDRDTLRVRRTIPLSDGASVRSLAADGEGGLLVSTVEQLLRVEIDTGVVTWRSPLGTTGGCYQLVITPRATIACASYVGVTEFELATGLPTGKALELQLDSVPDIGILDDATLLISSTFNSFWMRWRFDGSGAGSRVVGAGSVVAAGPDRDGGFVSAQPVAGGGARLWNLETDAAGTTADGLLLLGGGIVGRWDDGVGRLQNTATGEVYPYRIPGLPPEFYVMPGGPSRLGFVSFRERLVTFAPMPVVSFRDLLVAFDPATGESVGAPMTLPGWRVDGALSAGATPDESRVVFTWYDEEASVWETAVFDLQTGDLVVRGLLGVDETLVIGQDELIAVTDETVQRVALDTLEPRSSLPRATGGSQAMDVSADGRTLLNVGWNNRLTLYDLTRDIVLGEPIAAETIGIRGGYLSPDGETLIMGLRDGILLWDLVPEHQARAACDLAGRELSEQEWATYFPGEPQVATCAVLTR